MLISDSHVPPKQVLCKSHFSPIIGNGLTTDLKRTYNGPTVMAETEQMRIFFLELNTKHIHGSKKCMIKCCVSKRLGACICLPNIYTSYTHHIHAFCSYNQIIGYYCSFCKYSRRDDPCICCVYVWQTYTRF